jgi:hypothetical protein
MQHGTAGMQRSHKNATSNNNCTYSTSTQTTENRKVTRKATLNTSGRWAHKNDNEWWARNNNNEWWAHNNNNEWWACDNEHDVE